ncbi:MAG: hypothetical protein O2985_15950 [Proteobacteria bacterium]|nr:hypothetical protein [Pseudomonadota bacterium]
MGLFGKLHVKTIDPSARAVEIRPRGDSYVRIDGTDHAILAWNPGGFLVGPYSGALVARQIALVHLVLRDYHDPDGDLKVDDRVYIEKIDNEGLRARWWHLPERKKVEIATYYSRKTAKRT